MASEMEYKLQAVWSIKNEAFINAKEKDSIQSVNFNTSVPGVKYTFILHPKDKTFSAISIHSIASVKELKLFIRSANYEGDLLYDFHPENDNHEDDDYNGYGDVVFIKREDLLDPEKKFFVDDILTMEFYGTLIYKKEVLDLSKILWEKDDKDFTFVVGKEKIKIHKLILGQFSPVFDLKQNQIKIEHFVGNVVKTIVALCYGQEQWYFKCVRNKGMDQLFSVIEFTNIYDMPLIKKQVEFKLTNYIHEEIVCELANKSIEYKAEILRAYCVNFIANCTKDRKPFDGISDLKDEIAIEVLKETVCHKDGP